MIMHFREKMESNFMAALIEYKRSIVVHRAVLATVKARQNFTKRAEMFTLHTNGELWLAGKKVPTIEEVDEVLKNVHVNEHGRHLRDLKFLRNMLTERHYALPKYLGGLTNAIIE